MAGRLNGHLVYGQVGGIVVSEIVASLSEWLSERPQWLQIAAVRLSQQSELTDADISELVDLCKKESNKELPKSTSPLKLTGFSDSARGTLRLCGISNVEGVNALAPKKPLTFGGDNITIVYGSNGSGKSGYFRLLKHICGSRDMGPLHPNVFKSDSIAQKASVEYTWDGQPEIYTWLGKGSCEDLEDVNIYDTSFGKIYVDNDDELLYEPPVLSFLSSLILVCQKVGSALDIEDSRYQSKNPAIPADKRSTPEGQWYESLNVETKLEEINKYCTFNESDEAGMAMLQQRFAEKAPTEKAQQLRKRKQYVDSLVSDAEKYLEQLSDDTLQKVIKTKKNISLKKEAADKAAQSVFSESKLDGIGSDVWKELWAVARTYSITTAYQGFNYPNVSEGSRCVLCHQILTQEAKDRLISFEEFVKGEIQKAVVEAEREYQAILKAIEDLPTLEMLKARIDIAGVVSDTFSDQVMKFYAQLQTRKDKLFQADFDGITQPLLSPEWIQEANAFSKNLGERAAVYDEDAKTDNRDEIKRNLNSLQAKKWLSENRKSVVEEVLRLKQQYQISEARKLTNTQALSMHKGELAEALITNAFVRRFNKELKALGASKVSVELVKSNTKKGKVLHRLQLRGAPQNRIPDILSEGEARIVSIASFLADITGKNSRSPVIFDDPISSLDQDYEEAVVKRLIALSQTNQIIVFTHRLSLLGLLQEYADSARQKSHIICIHAETWGAGEPRDIPLFVEKPKDALKKLINNRLPDAKRVYQNDGKEKYEPIAKVLCKDFRIILERMIENDLMSNIVQRHRRMIYTKGKLRKLAKISDADCRLFDDLMTKYSTYEHSQSPETPSQVLEPDELKEDFEGLMQWLDEFTKRSTIGVS